MATAVQARIVNNGQSCIATKRFIVDNSIADKFEQKFTERMAALKVGDPMDSATDVGPIATADVLHILEEQVNKTVSMGARALTGGKRANRQGISFSQQCSLRFPKNPRGMRRSCLDLWPPYFA